MFRNSAKSAVVPAGLGSVMVAVGSLLGRAGRQVSFENRFRTHLVPEQRMARLRGGGVVHLRKLLAGGDEPVSTIVMEAPVFPDAATVRHEPDGTLVVPGRFPIHDLPDVGVKVRDGDYATVAGLVLDALGRIPAVGDALIVDAWRIEVRAMHRHSITEVAMTAMPPDSEAAGTTPPSDQTRAG